MTRHSRNNTAGAFYSYAERKKDSENSGFGSANKRLSKDSVGDFDVCNLSLQICKDPVVTPEGVIYEREAILTYMVDQKAKIVATKKRKAKEEEKKDEEIPKKIFKGQCKRHTPLLPLDYGELIWYPFSECRCCNGPIWIRSKCILETRI